MSNFKVYVVGSDANISGMFRTVSGFDNTADIHKADIVVFPGGADINPKLYGEEPIDGTYVRPIIDQRDLLSWEEVEKEQIKVGICRGGQFLNVMCGGKLWQDVSHHTGAHSIIDFALTGSKIDDIISTHHQQMIVGEGGELLAAAERLSKKFRNAEFPDGIPQNKFPRWEPEVVWYKEENALCFQPHPEYSPGNTRSYFFALLNRILKM